MASSTGSIVLQIGIVKAVPSGDSLTILQFDDNNRDEYREILFTFLGLKAPQLGRRVNEGKTQDEPFAWQSREFLRNLMIGQPIIYRVSHHDKASDRYYGELWDHKENDVRFMIVENGWSDVILKRKVNNQGIELEPSISQQQLEGALQEAKNKKKGIWSNHTDESIRRMKYIEISRDPKTDLLTADDLFEFYKSHRNRKAPLNGIVESVKTGSQLNILLPDTMQQFPLFLTGIRCPGFKENEPELYHKEAKFITEYYLLHRNVTITLDSMDKLNIYGTVLLDGETNVAFDLLRMGLANFVEWSVPKNNHALIERLKEEEQNAQQNNRRLWRSFKPISAPGKKGEKATKERSVVTGKVVEIVNAGVITVRVTNPNKTVDRIIPLSSIRPPRSFKVNEEPPKTGSDKPLTPEQEKAWKEEVEENKRENAYAAEAKEFLRNLLIGQKVRCVFDYLRPAIPKNQKEEKNPMSPRLYWSVYLNDKNVAIELVKQGLAKVSSHTEGENRSAEYQDLIFAEKDAISQNKGIHNPVYNKAGLRLNDLTPPPLVKEKEVAKEGDEGRASRRKGILSKCRVFLGHLQRVNKVEAIVEYVLTGSRYKLVIPSQSCVLLFNLQACIVDRPVRREITSAVKPDVSVFDKQYPPDCPGNITLQFARDNLFQRKVHITVTNLDNFGIFSGTLLVNNKDFGLTLIENGHAKLHKKSAQKLPGFDALKKAEEVARKELRGLWATYDFEAEKERKNQDVQTKSEEKEFEITITDFRNGALFSYQIINSELNGLKELSDTLQNEKWSRQEPYSPSVGEIVVAQFTSDDVWYRARVVADNKPKGPKATGEPTEFEVRYIDYGNREVLGKDRIRKIPDIYVDSLPPQAHEGKLFGVKAPSLDSDFGRDSAEGFREFVWDKTLTATEVQKDRSSGISHLILRDEDRTNINIAMVKSGLARTEKGYRDDFVRVTLKEAQEEARAKRNGIWQCGYYPDSDEERELERSLLR